MVYIDHWPLLNGERWRAMVIAIPAKVNGLVNEQVTGHSEHLYGSQSASRAQHVVS